MAPSHRPDASVLTHSFASCFGESFFGSAVLDENGFGGGDPRERFRILVSMLNPFVDCGFEFRNVVENASPYTLSGDFGEEPLDEVEPGAGRRREVQDEAFASCQPAFHGRYFVGGVVVEDQMQIEMGGGLAINFLRKTRNASALWRARHSPVASMTLPVAMSSAANSVVLSIRLPRKSTRSLPIFRVVRFLHDLAGLELA
jgi:hypothetical protein